MGYLLPEYATDIFISYSQGDFDQLGTSDLLEWSNGFAKHLENELRQDPKFRSIALFIDLDKRHGRGMDRTLPLTKQLRDTLEGTALFMVLMSPHYVKSVWCRDERESWMKHHAPQGIHSGRIFVARIWPVDDKEWPNELCDENGVPPIGFCFHSKSVQEYTARPLGWRGRSADNGEYIDRLLQLTGAVLLRLRDMKTKLEARKKAQEEMQRLSAADGQILYLYARERDRTLWTAVSEALNELGYTVFPGDPEPHAETPERLHQITQERVGHLVGCDALVLLGTKDGMALDGDMLSVGRQSRNLARERSGKLLPCAVFDRSGGSIETSARVSAARRLKIGWINGTSPEWPQGLRDWLRQMGARLDGAA